MFAMFTIIARALLIPLKKHSVPYIHIFIYMGFTCNPIHFPFKASLKSVFLKNFTVFVVISQKFEALPSIFRVLNTAPATYVDWTLNLITCVSPLSCLFPWDSRLLLRLSSRPRAEMKQQEHLPHSVRTSLWSFRGPPCCSKLPCF